MEPLLSFAMAGLSSRPSAKMILLKLNVEGAAFDAVADQVIWSRS